MSSEVLKTLSDTDLKQWIQSAQAELVSRVDQRKKDAMEQIRKIAADAQLRISFQNGRSNRGTRLKAGQNFTNPDNPKESYTVGKGRTPAWFERMRAKGPLP